MSEFEIRKAIPADADAVADYHDRCFRNTYSSQMLAGEFEAPDLAGTRQQIHDWFLPESGLESRVAVVDGAPIGHVTVCGHQLVHLFDEPQLNTQDGYIGFMLRFFRRLRSEGKLVFVCLHPNERWQLDLLRELSETLLFVHRGAVSQFADFGALAARPEAREYLGALLD